MAASISPDPRLVTTCAATPSTWESGVGTSSVATCSETGGGDACVGSSGIAIATTIATDSRSSAQLFAATIRGPRTAPFPSSNETRASYASPVASVSTRTCARAVGAIASTPTSSVSCDSSAAKSHAPLEISSRTGLAEVGPAERTITAATTTPRTMAPMLSRVRRYRTAELR